METSLMVLTVIAMVLAAGAALVAERRRVEEVRIPFEP
jgi:hypothetical protein